MSVKYSLALMSTKPGKADAPKKYYAKAQADGEVSMDEMADDIAYATSLTDGDVLNVLRALIKQINKHLANGKIIRLENMGSFQMQVCSTGADDEKKFTSSNITRGHIQFRPGKFVKATTRAGEGGLTFQRVPKKGEATTKPGGGGSGGDGGIEDDPLG